MVLERCAHVYDLQTLTPLGTIDTPDNPSGVAALTPCTQPCLLALPAGDGSTGTMRWE